MEEITGILTATLFVATCLYFVGLVWWKIFSKAGYHGALGLLMFVPPINLVMICVLAFGEWPVRRKLVHLSKMLPADRRSMFGES